jgi:hypothetical protein
VCPASSVAWPPPDRGRPAELRADLGWWCQAPWPRAAALGGRVGGPGAGPQRPAGRGVTGWGQSPRLAPRPRGRRCREHAHAGQPCAGGIDTAAGAHGRHQRDGPRAWHTAPGLQGCAPRVHTPRVPVRVACWGETLASCGVVVDGADSGGTDEGWCGCGADHGRAPPERGRAPMGPAGGAASVAAAARVASTRGVLTRAAGLCTGPRAVSSGGIVDCGASDPGERTRARQPGPWPGVPALGVDAGTGLWGPACGGHHPAVIAWLRDLSGAPAATGARRIDTAQRCGLRWPRAAAVSAGTRTGADGPQGDDLGAVLRSDSGDRHRVVVDLPSDVPRARRAPGCPPRAWWIVPATMHDAALAAGTLTRVHHGGQPTHRKSLCLGAKRSVVIAKLGDEQGVCLDFIDYPMFIINAS